MGKDQELLDASRTGNVELIDKLLSKSSSVVARHVWRGRDSAFKIKSVVLTNYFLIIRQCMLGTVKCSEHEPCR